MKRTSTLATAADRMQAEIEAAVASNDAEQMRATAERFRERSWNVELIGEAMRAASDLERLARDVERGRSIFEAWPEPEPEEDTEGAWESPSWEEP